MSKEITWKEAFAEVVAEQAGPVTPLFVCCPVSAARMNLLDKIRSAVEEKHREAPALYLSAEQFYDEFLEALRTANTSVFRKRFHDAPLMVVDGLQEITGRRAAHIELLQAIKALLHDGRQVIIGVDRPLAELYDFAPELIACLNGGTACRAEDG